MEEAPWMSAALADDPLSALQGVTLQKAARLLYR